MNVQNSHPANSAAEIDWQVGYGEALRGSVALWEAKQKDRRAGELTKSVQEKIANRLP